jgi:hypothetical protein
LAWATVLVVNCDSHSLPVAQWPCRASSGRRTRRQGNAVAVSADAWRVIMAGVTEREQQRIRREGKRLTPSSLLRRGPGTAPASQHHPAWSRPDPLLRPSTRRAPYVQTAPGPGVRRRLSMWLPVAVGPEGTDPFLAGAARDNARAAVKSSPGRVLSLIKTVGKIRIFWSYFSYFYII